MFGWKQGSIRDNETAEIPSDALTKLKPVKFTRLLRDSTKFRNLGRGSKIFSHITIVKIWKEKIGPIFSPSIWDQI